MSKLTDTQLIVLSKAAQRDDGAAVLSERLNKAAAAKVAKSLVGRKLMREIRAKPGMPIWREDANERKLSLIITRAGRDAIGVVDHIEDASALDIPTNDAPMPLVLDAKPKNGALRAGSKIALIISMLSRESGATAEALIASTGWLPHTTRAAFTGLRKRGFVIERSRGDDKVTRYRVSDQPKDLSNAGRTNVASVTHAATAA